MILNKLIFKEVLGFICITTTTKKKLFLGGKGERGSYKDEVLNEIIFQDMSPSYFCMEQADIISHLQPRSNFYVHAVLLPSYLFRAISEMAWQLHPASKIIILER